MLTVNGRQYPLWSQFVERKEEWIGGVLQDFGDSMDRAIGLAGPEGATTEITDITLEPNGTDSAMFSVDGKDFGCASDVQVLGIVAGDEGWITLNGYGGHTWRIKRKRYETQRTRTNNARHVGQGASESRDG